MNIIRTIRSDEKEDWVNLLFKEGNHRGENVPEYPPKFPFPFTFKEDVRGKFLYLVYRSKMIGYGNIAAVESHEETPVGSGDEVIPAGEMLVMAESLKEMPFELKCRGFAGIRYTEKNLHELEEAAVKEELRELKLG